MTTLADLSLWRTGAAPEDGTVIKARFVSVLRFKRYKPNSLQGRRAIAGRWQKLNIHGGWENTDERPVEWQRYEQGE
jgi:hypothetical protein